MTFIFNRWVRGEDFYGRVELLVQLQTRVNEGRPTWVMGNRRLGKTSLLRQVEWLVRHKHWPNRHTLFWDLQGAGDAKGLKDALLEALEDAEDLLDTLDLDVDALEESDFGDILNKLRRRIKSVGVEVLMLIDECEELVECAAAQPAILSSFRKLTHTRGLNLILSGSLRMMDLDESQSRTSPFLPDFLPPLMLEPFTSTETQKLLTDKGLTVDQAAQIQELTFGNPHLSQVLGEHFQRLENLDRALKEIVRDKICHYFFQSNFLCLPESMRGWLAAGEASTRLAQFTPDDPNWPYARQAVLVRQSEADVVVSPLLGLVEAGHLLPTPQTTATTIATPASSPPQTDQTPFFDEIEGFIQAFAKRETSLTALPHELLEAGDTALLVDAQDPPSLNMLASIDEEAERLHVILDGASPEYTLGREAGPRTLVYLLGLHLYYRFFGGSPTAHIEDTWTRTATIADKDVTITRDQVEKVAPKIAMILMRCLKADPSERYDQLEAVRDDFLTASQR